jgi:hypothetical protein
MYQGSHNLTDIMKTPAITAFRTAKNLRIRVKQWSQKKKI